MIRPVSPFSCSLLYRTVQDNNEWAPNKVEHLVIADRASLSELSLSGLTTLAPCEPHFSSHFPVHYNRAHAGVAKALTTADP